MSKVRNILATSARVLTVALAMTVCLSAGALTPKKDKKAAQKEPEVDIYELSIDDNLRLPSLGASTSKIVDFQYQQALQLKKNQFMVETMRSGEVLVVTIPAGVLFAPNDTVLSDVGQEVLRKFLKYLKTPGRYKMILAMHSDDTGSSKYLIGLTRSRVDAVFDWIDHNGSVEYVVPYALGGTDPLKPNNSMQNRHGNRRLEIYLVPEKMMIQAAQRGIIQL